MNATLRSLPVLVQSYLTRPTLRSPRAFWRNVGVCVAACGLLGMVWVQPQPDTQSSIQVRHHGLSTCNDALTTQALDGHRIDGFRLLPSSIKQEGQLLQANYHAHLSGQNGWNSGPMRTVHCVVTTEQVALSVLAD